LTHILLICYSFPPFPGIGGRRWAKFAKCLAKENYTVHVICAKNQHQHISLYTDDVKFDNIFKYPLPAKYPLFMYMPPKTFLEKILYRIWLVYLKTFTKGNYYDKAILWEKQLLTKSSELITQYSINKVIVSGAPFSLLHHVVKIKQKFPSIKLYGDIRDPWTWGSYGINNISKNKRAEEESKESLVVSNYDAVFLPVQPMVNYMKEKYKDSENKFILLPHAFDADEIPAGLQKNIIKENKIEFILYGTLYQNIEKNIAFFIPLILNNSYIKLAIYSGEIAYKNMFEEKGLLNTQVVYNKPLPPKQLFEKVKNSNFVLIIHPYNPNADGISTKFYEIIKIGTPILFIGYDEYIIEFIKTNELGIAVNPNRDKMPSIQELLKFKYKDSFNSEDYSFQNITKNILIKYIEQ